MSDYSEGCCDNCNVDCGGWFETLREKRNAISSSVAGVLFALGWWLIIDASVQAEIVGVHHLIGVFSTLGLIMVNSISAGMLDGDSYTEGICGPAGARVWLILGLMMSFGGFIAGAWIMAQQYLEKKDREDYGGICLFMQNLLILLSSMVFKFGRGGTGSYGW